MAEEKEEFKYGVKKEIITSRINAYNEIVNGKNLDEGDPSIALNVLLAQFENLIKKEEIALDDPEREAKLQELEAKKSEIIASAEEVTKNNEEYFRAQDSIDELEDLLKTSKEERSFVEIEEIQQRLATYREMLSKLDIGNLRNRKAQLEEEIKKAKEELEKLKAQSEKEKEENGENSKSKTSVEPGNEYVETARNRAISDLEEKISNREAMIAGRGDQLPQIRFDQLAHWKALLVALKSDDWKSALKEVEVSNDLLRDEANGTDTLNNIMDNAKNSEIKDLEEKISNREAMIAGRGDQLHPDRFKELAQWKDRLSQLQNPSKEQSEEKSETDKKIEELEKNISEKENELEKVNKDIEEFDKRNPVDVIKQKRTLENKIKELENLEKEKSIFRITDKGDIEITYPDVEMEIDEDAIAEEYLSRRTDMLDKYYGNKDKAEEYKERMEEFKSHIVEKEFEFIDKDGKRQVGVYQTVEDYEDLEGDAQFLQLEEYSKRLERITRAEAGDPRAYANAKDPKAAMEYDKNYVETNNNAYNRLVSTRDNLMTLGKYGEKVDYNKLQEGEPVRNIIRAVGNIGKFVRNHTTAPISKFIGSKIVSPIYGAVTGADKGNVAGLYSNKISHRYVARREYFASQGKGYFSSRFNSIFNAKEGNKAILSAGAYDIRESIKVKYIDQARKEARQKQVEFAGKNIESQIEMIKADMEKSTDPKSKEKFAQTLELLERAKSQVEKDKAAADRMVIHQTRQTDAVDMDEHDKANKENVTRTVTGVKMLARFGFRKFVGPKIKEWLIARSKKPQTRIETYTAEEPTQKWVDTTYKNEEVPVFGTKANHSNSTLEDVMQSNAGKQVEGYYSVYGGERKPALYNLTGNEKITGVFQAEGVRGTGLSDTAGLTAPTLTDRTFGAGMLASNGVLKQDLTIEQIISAVGEGKVNADTLEGLYVSVGDKCWMKLADLYKATQDKVQIGTEIRKVVDVPAHMETITQMVEKTREITEMVEDTKIVGILDNAGLVLRGADGALLVDDMYENLRKTETDVRKTKPQPRRHDYDSGYTGKKTEDYDLEVEEIKVEGGVLKGGRILPEDKPVRRDDEDKEDR